MRKVVLHKMLTSFHFCINMAIFGAAREKPAMSVSGQSVVLLDNQHLAYLSAINKYQRTKLRISA